MKRIKRQTPLAQWLRNATDDERQKLAALAGTSKNYLYQLAACRREPKARLALLISQGTVELKRKGLQVISIEQLGTMHALEGIE